MLKVLVLTAWVPPSVLIVLALLLLVPLLVLLPVVLALVILAILLALLLLLRLELFGALESAGTARTSGTEAPHSKGSELSASRPELFCQGAASSKEPGYDQSVSKHLPSEQTSRNKLDKLGHQLICLARRRPQKVSCGESRSAIAASTFWSWKAGKVVPCGPRLS